jgi:hypothetical protein
LRFGLSFGLLVHNIIFSHSLLSNSLLSHLCTFRKMLILVPSLIQQLLCSRASSSMHMQLQASAHYFTFTSLIHSFNCSVVLYCFEKSANYQFHGSGSALQKLQYPKLHFTTKAQRLFLAHPSLCLSWSPGDTG